MSKYDDAVMADSPPIDDVQLAAIALQSLRTSTSPAASPPPDDIAPPATSFLSRVHNSAVKVYNSGKSYSPRFRYSAEKIESVAGSIRRGAYYSTTTTAASATATSITSSPTSTNASGTATPTPRHGAHHHHHHPHTHQRKGSGVGGISGGVKKRTRPVWQNMLVTATSLATLSDESRQRLRYFLHMLKLANTRLATTINKLQENIQREQANAMAQNIAANHVPQEQQQQQQDDANSVNYLKQDLINTIKKIVTVISTFAGNSLPEPARSHVRSYVMRLPANWANSVNCTPQTVTPQESTTPSTATTSSSSSSETHSTSATTRTSSAVNIEDEMMMKGSSADNDRDKEIEAGGRVLTLATETLDMLGNIISVVDETLERAETWCARIGYNNLDDDEKSATTSLPGSQSPELPHYRPDQMNEVA